MVLRCTIVSDTDIYDIGHIRKHMIDFRFRLATQLEERRKDDVEAGTQGQGLFKYNTSL